MRSLIETAVLITGCGSAICWFASAMWHLPRHQAGQRRIGQSERIIYQVAKNKPVELLGRGADGRNRLAVSVGQSSRMILAHDHGRCARWWATFRKISRCDQSDTDAEG